MGDGGSGNTRPTHLCRHQIISVVDMPKTTRAYRPEGKRWCFTLNNYNDESVQLLKSKVTEDSCSFAIIGKEVGESGTPHLQGYIHLKKKQRFSAVKAFLPSGCHIEQAKGTDRQNEEYCSKDELLVLRVGRPAKGTTERGGGSGSVNTAVEMAKRIAAGESQTDILQDTEHAAAFIRHQKGFEALKNMYIQAENIKKIRGLFDGSKWYAWQIVLMRYLCDCIPNPRRVTWYVDFEGNSGKTYLSKWLITHKDAVRFENGKSSDVKFAYRGQKIVIFDLSRSQEDHVNYEVIESVKNGVIFSPKYESRCAVYMIPHVVVFANFEPDKSKLSFDRWDIRHISEKDKEWAVEGSDIEYETFSGSQEVTFEAEPPCWSPDTRNAKQL